MNVAFSPQSIRRALPYTVAFLVPFSAILGPIFGGLFWYSTCILGFLFIPALDALFGEETYQPSVEEEVSEKSALPYKVLTWIYAPVHVGITTWGAWYFANHDLTLWQALGLISCVGVSSGALGFTVGHELCHRGERFERFLAICILSYTNYTHFIIEHCVGHHARVATPHDPASSRFGESLYAFLPRTIIGSWQSAWAYEKKRVGRYEGKNRFLKNRMLHYMGIQLLLNILFLLFFGLAGLMFFWIISVISIFLLEVINYVEHYGLVRKKLDTKRDRYEKVQPHHSWNANHKLSNLFLFRLQRHSDHHANPLRRYQILRHYDDVPQLPYGYPTMTLLAIVPFFWRKVMDPRVGRLTS